MKMVTFVSGVLFVIFLAPCNCSAAFFGRHAADTTLAADTSSSLPTVHSFSHPRSFLRHLAAKRLVSRFYGRHGEPHNNSVLGILSLACVGISIVFAWGVMTWGLSVLGVAASVGFAICAIVLGAIGIHKDKRPGYAKAGVGLGVAAAIVFTSFAFLLMTFGAL